LQKSRRIKIWRNEIQDLIHILDSLTDTSLDTINRRNEIQYKITALELKIANVREGLPEIGEKSGIQKLKGL
jgi:hypothetical protein